MDEYNAGEILRDVWPEWTIVGSLGSGSYGEVYKIVRGDASMHDSEIFSESAVKIISVPRDKSELDTLGNNQEFIRQSQNEYEGLASDLSSEIHLLESLKGASNVVHIEDYRIRKNEENIGWTIIIRMELLRSIKELYPFSEEETIKLGIDICSALEVCSKKNIIHRDIKPSNIFITEFGDYKLGDFGISKIMQSANVSMTQGIGTPNFVAPEVVNGEHYDFRADIYSLGMVLYHLLNNLKQPFQPQDKQILSYHDRVDSYLRRVRGEALPPPVNASPRLAQIILKACAFKPEDRYAGAGEMKRALKELSIIPPEKKPRRKLWMIILAAALSLALLSAAVFGRSMLDHKAQKTDLPKDDGAESSAIQDTGSQADTPVPPEENDAESAISQDTAPPAAEAVPETPSAVGLSIAKYPQKTSYAEGDTLDITGLVLTAHYYDEEQMVTDGFTCSPEVLTESGMQEITVSFGGLTATFNVFVKPLFTYSLNRDEQSYTLTKCLSQDITEVNIPQTHNGYPVTVIGADAFTECSIVSLIIPEGITKIEGHAFYHCLSLESIQIPKTVVNISLKGGEDNQHFGSPFARCESLVKIEIDPANPVYHSDGNCVIETAAKRLILGCNGSIIPGDGSVTEIGECSFDEAYTPSSLTIPEGVEKISAHAFDATGLSELVIPKTVVSIHPRIIENCNNMERLEVEEGNPVYHSEGNCIIDSKTDTLVLGCKNTAIPSDGSVTKIGDHAFGCCSGLKSIRIPDNVVSIESKAFAHCADLETVKLSASIASIDPSSFYDCPSLAKIIVSPDNPVYHASGNCVIETGTKTLILGCPASVIPADGSVEIIGNIAFEAVLLKSVVIPEGVLSIEEDAFLNSGIEELYISSTVRNIHESSFPNCPELMKIVVDEANPVYHSNENCIIETETKRLILGCRTSVIPDDGSVVQINACAFYGSGLSSITIPETVTVIKNTVFSYTKLNSIILPSGITTIFEYAFLGCSMLTNIYIPKNVTEIREHAFKGCGALATIYYEGSKADWNKIIIREDNAYLLNAEIIYDYGK